MIVYGLLVFSLLFYTYWRSVTGKWQIIFLLLIKIFSDMLLPVNNIYKIHIFFLLPVTLFKSNGTKIYSGDLKNE